MKSEGTRLRLAIVAVFLLSVAGLVVSTPLVVCVSLLRMFKGPAPGVLLILSNWWLAVGAVGLWIRHWQILTAFLVLTIIEAILVAAGVIFLFVNAIMPFKNDVQAVSEMQGGDSPVVSFFLYSPTDEEHHESCR